MLFPDTAANVAASVIEIELLKPADVLQRMLLSENQVELSQPVLATDACIDVEKNPRYAPVTDTCAAPVDGKFMNAHDDIAGGKPSTTVKDEML